MGLLVSSCPPEIAHPKKFLSLSSALEVITFINHDIHGNTFLVLLQSEESGRVVQYAVQLLSVLVAQLLSVHSWPPDGGQQGLTSASGVRWHAVSLCNTCLTT